MTNRYNVTGPARKTLVAAVSEITNTPVEYLGAPGFQYRVGEYVIDKTGTLTGPDSLNLGVALLERGFEEERSETFHLITPRGTLLCQKRYDTDEEAHVDGYGMYFHHEGRDVYVKAAPDGATEHSKHFAVVGAPFEPATQADATPDTAPDANDAADTPPADTPADDQLVISVPLDGFDPPKLDNLFKLVDSKATLIKKALGVDDLPIPMTLGNSLEFPWFNGDLDSDSINAYTQFVTALCETAKRKTRVVAKDSGEYENERFAMRLFTVALGLIGPEYRLIRKLLTKPMDGNGAWRYGPPEKKASVAPDAATDGTAEHPEGFFEAQSRQVTDTITAAIEANLAESAGAE